MGSLVAALLPFTTHTALAAPAESHSAETGRYVVTLTDQPIATYDGGVNGISATKPAQHAKVDVTSAAARRYRTHLEERQNQVARSVGATARRHYAVATSAFSAELTATQMVRLKATPGVTSVVPDVLNRTTDDRVSTDFLRLSGHKGLWSALGGAEAAGRGIVVGDIDTGIWPESRSLDAPSLGTKRPPASDPYRPYRSGTTTMMRKADGSTFTGACQSGERFNADDCNQKVIGARYFGETWLDMVPEANRADYVSPRDGQGHGTHTATTAAGNFGVRASVDGRNLGTVSGVAPGAKIAVYKALWESKDGTQSGGMTSDIVAAIEQAVADGVDVINYSVGTLFESSLNGPVQAAFRNASAAGIFVSASAGNNGPDQKTLDNTPPWVTTVAAGTIAPHKGTVVLGDGTRYTGVSTTITRDLGPKPLVAAETVKAAGASAYDASLCAENTLDAAKTTGKIVVCDRGVNARTAKSAEVARAGGVGMVLVNLSASSMDADLHPIPTVHLNGAGAKTVRDYALTDGASATLTTGGSDTPYPQVAEFSSRGPSVANGGNLLKPDITAPGVSILAAVAPPTNGGHAFAFQSGTSMAAPHISGLAALYLGEHPSWSPMRVKSAMMTTTTPTKTSAGAVSSDVFAQGAGEVNPSTMLQPGLVYDSTEQDWLAYLEGSGVDTGTGVAAKDPSDLNYPSIAVNELLGRRTVTRTVTAVTPGTYTAHVSPLTGVKTTVSPSTLRFTRPGQTRTFEVTFAVDTATVGTPVTGSLTWSGAHRSVRSPIVVTPQSVRAPERVTGAGAAGQVSFTATPAVRPFTATAYGPARGDRVHGSVTSHGGPTDSEQYFTVPIAAGTKAVEFTARTDSPDAQVALVVWPLVDGQPTSSGEVVLPTNDASVALPRPQVGDYRVAVVTLGDAEGTTSTPFTLQTNSVGSQALPAGKVTVTPTSYDGPVGVALDVSASWSGILTSDRSTAWIEYPNGAGTVLSLN
ncbi:S8 family serine peptidase [Streptomyces sp. BBFR25]|uniref:S8 family serine peptidase n=1 Tax=unclassified Streptomyces TaxID=2593676 RepID=UPI0027E30F00|nr:S8 family serine peptidase [Streptomyces sp. RM72]